MWTENQFIDEVSAKTEISLNKDQREALEAIYKFLFTGGTQSAFILRGYAGTGKTTLMGCLIRWFHSINRKTVLLAPTGRSAKVLASHSGFPASTIHRRIYAVKDDGAGRMSMQLVENRSERTLFLVDEASMIGDASQNDGGLGRSLIHDLVEYVYSGEKCRLILIGDEAQLPPVGMELSPALSAKDLTSILGGPVFESTLRSVVRQASDSLILSNATHIRNSIAEADFNALSIKTKRDGDVQIVEPDDLEDALINAFHSDDNRSVMVCRSNKDAYQFNQQIRVRIFDREEILEAGDRIMIVKNNYHWKIPGRRQNFLANGDMVMVERVFGISEFGEFRFAECLVRLVDEEVEAFHLIVLLNTIDFDGPSIPPKQMKSLREAMIKSGALDEAEDVARFFQNPYFNAAQVKYAYAVTCHKSQGGQWNNVFVYQGYLTEEMLDKSYFRWLYTAITRATQQLYLVGFHPNFLGE
ncbi:MAG: AAA family ATPase [Salibacteraceae bacterium]